MSSVAQKRRDIKAGINPTDLRRRRADTTVSLRKQKREQGVAKRRTLLTAKASAPQGSQGPAPIPSHVPDLTHALKSDDASARTNAARGLRKLLSLETNPPVTEVIDAGALPLLVLCLDHNPDQPNTDLQINEWSISLVPLKRGVPRPAFMTFTPRHSGGFVERIHINPENWQQKSSIITACREVIEPQRKQFEAAWALTNIASTCKTRAVVEHGAVPALVRNLRHQNADLREQCAWCLGNIAGDCADLRDVVLGCTDSLEGLLLNITQPATQSLQRNCVWALSNMCRGKPQPKSEVLAPAVPVLHALLSCEDTEVLVDTCWALSYLSDGDADCVLSINSASGSLVPLLQHEDSNVVTPALRTLGNFVTGDDAQTQAVLDLGVLPFLQVLLHHSKKNIRKEACWTLSNIAAGTPDQLASMCDSPGVLTRVIEVLSSDAWEVQKEANFVVSNVATASSRSRIRQLVDLGAIQSLCQMLGRADAKVILVSLDAISSILACDDEDSGSPWRQVFDESGGLDLLEQLQEHENSKVYDKAVEMIERFFGCEDDEEDDDVAPTAAGGVFSFGCNPSEMTPNKSPSACGLEMNNATSMGLFGSPVRTLNFA